MSKQTGTGEISKSAAARLESSEVLKLQYELSALGFQFMYSNKLFWIGGKFFSLDQIRAFIQKNNR